MGLKAFATGSYVYGPYGDKSDLDIAVTLDDFDPLVGWIDPARTWKSAYMGGVRLLSWRADRPINVIALRNCDFAAWCLATNAMPRDMPDKEKKCVVFQLLVQAYKLALPQMSDDELQRWWDWNKPSHVPYSSVLRTQGPPGPLPEIPAGSGQ